MVKVSETDELYQDYKNSNSENKKSLSTRKKTLGKENK